MSKLLVLALAGALLAGCSILPSSKSQPLASYTLSPALPQTTAVAKTCPAVLRVNAVEASSPWGSDGLIYSDSRFRIATFAYNKWAAPPAEMLTDALVKAIATSGLYRGVLGPTDPGDARLVLAVRLVRGPLQTFAGVERSPASSTESMALSATLADLARGKLVAGKEFSAAQAAAPNPYGGVVAANELAGKLIADIVVWLGATGAGGLCQGG